MNNLSTIKPYTPTFKATPQKQAEGNYTFYEMNSGVLPYAAISKHRKNQKAGKEDDHITQTVMKHLTSPKRLLRVFASNLAIILPCAFMFAEKPVFKTELITSTLLAAAISPFSHFMTAGSSARIELGKEQGHKQPWLNEFFYKILNAD